MGDRWNPARRFESPSASFRRRLRRRQDPASWKGTVESWRFANPHCSLQIQADDGAGKTITWSFEGNPAGMLTQLGYRRNTFTPAAQGDCFLQPDEGRQARRRPVGRCDLERRLDGRTGARAMTAARGSSGPVRRSVGALRHRRCCGSTCGDDAGVRPRRGVGKPERAARCSLPRELSEGPSGASGGPHRHLHARGLLGVSTVSEAETRGARALRSRPSGRRGRAHGQRRDRRLLAARHADHHDSCLAVPRHRPRDVRRHGLQLREPGSLDLHRRSRSTPTRMSTCRATTANRSAIGRATLSSSTPATSRRTNTSSTGSCRSATNFRIVERIQRHRRRRPAVDRIHDDGPRKLGGRLGRDEDVQASRADGLRREPCLPNTNEGLPAMQERVHRSPRRRSRA